MRRPTVQLYATTYPGIGLGLTVEWVGNQYQPGCSEVECVLALPFITFNLNVGLSPWAVVKKRW